MSHLATERLNSKERSRFRLCNSGIKEKLKLGESSFKEAGELLREVRDERLYREDYKTFEAYVQAEHSIGRRRAYQLIEAAETANRLCTMVHKSGAVAVHGERQMRELTHVSVEKVPEVLGRAAEITEGKPITAKALSQAVAEVAPKPEKPRKVKAETVLENAPKVVDLAATEPQQKIALPVTHQNVEVTKELLEQAEANLKPTSKVDEVAVAKPEDRLLALLAQMDSELALSIVLGQIGSVDEQAEVIKRSHKDLAVTLGGEDGNARREEAKPEPPPWIRSR